MRLPRGHAVLTGEVLWRRGAPRCAAAGPVGRSRIGAAQVQRVPEPASPRIRASPGAVARGRAPRAEAAFHFARWADVPRGTGLRGVAGKGLGPSSPRGGPKRKSSRLRQGTGTATPIPRCRTALQSLSVSRETFPVRPRHRQPSGSPGAGATPDLRSQAHQPFVLLGPGPGNSYNLASRHHRCMCPRARGSRWIFPNSST